MPSCVRPQRRAETARDRACDRPAELPARRIGAARRGRRARSAQTPRPLAERRLQSARQAPRSAPRGRPPPRRTTPDPARTRCATPLPSPVPRRRGRPGSRHSVAGLRAGLVRATINASERATPRRAGSVVPRPFEIAPGTVERAGDPLVLLPDPVQELEVVEQVRERGRAEREGDEVRRVGLVDLPHTLLEHRGARRRTAASSTTSRALLAAILCSSAARRRPLRRRGASSTIAAPARRSPPRPRPAHERRALLARVVSTPLPASPARPGRGGRRPRVEPGLIGAGIARSDAREEQCAGEHGQRGPFDGP